MGVFGGGGDIFTVGMAYQTQANGAGSVAEPTDFSAFIVDALFEKPLENGAAVTLEGEYKHFDAPITASAAMPTSRASRWTATDSRSACKYRSDFEDIHTCNHRSLRRPAASRA